MPKSAYYDWSKNIRNYNFCENVPGNLETDNGWWNSGITI